MLDPRSWLQVVASCLKWVTGARLTPGPLQEQYAFLTAESSLYPCGAYVLLTARMSVTVTVMLVRRAKQG